MRGHQSTATGMFRRADSSAARTTARLRSPSSTIAIGTAPPPIRWRKREALADTTADTRAARAGRRHGRLANGGERPGRPDPVSWHPRDLQLWQHTMTIHPQRALLPDEFDEVCGPGTKAHVHLRADTPAHREHQRRAVVLRTA